MTNEIEERGFKIVPLAIDESSRQQLLSILGPVPGAGRRGLLELPEVATLARSKRLLDLIHPHPSSKLIPVRAIYFDKSAEGNWLVPWHQDLTIAVRERAESPGFGPWSIKDGVPHVQPPVELLEQMITIRIHLDDADESNGALRVLAGSHRMGRLSAERIQELRAQLPEILCAVRAGDVLMMRPLLLHASGRSTKPGHRRVLHIEYAAFELPPNLHWNEGRQATSRVT